MTMTLEIKDSSGKLAELVKQVQAGNEIVLTDGSKPVAKLVAGRQNEPSTVTPFQVHSIKGHRVLTPVISQGEIADEMW